MSFRVHRETVKFSGGEFAVRGLSLNDVSALLRTHREAIAKLFAEFQSGENLDKAAEHLFQTAPEVAVSVIRLAADDPEGEFDLLPAGVAVLAIEKIGTLTFEGEGGLGKVLEVLTSAVEGISKSVPISTSGFTGSDATLPS